jgi:hypothetical protein
MSALRLINKTTAIDGVSEVNITDVFSADFDIYKITFTDLSSNSNADFNMRWLNTSGSAITSSQYDRAKYYMNSNVSAGDVRTTNQNYIVRPADAYAYSAVANTGFGVMYVYNPFSSSSYTFFSAQGGTLASVLSTSRDIGVLTETTSIGGFQFYVSTTFKTLNVRTYGLRVDS